MDAFSLLTRENDIVEITASIDQKNLDGISALLDDLVNPMSDIYDWNIEVYDEEGDLIYSEPVAEGFRARDNLFCRKVLMMCFLVEIKL